MTHHMLDFLRTFGWHVDMGGPVLEIGSYIEENQEHLDLRQVFPRGTVYVGVDILKGHGVDKQLDLFDQTRLNALVDDLKPKTVLCLYVLEHVWEIRRAMEIFGGLWKRNPESWLWVSTHQTQPYHGTKNYADYWRITGQGMQKLFESEVVGGHVLLHPDMSNPTDVVAVRPPASMGWPTKAFEKTLKLVSTCWEQLS